MMKFSALTCHRSYKARFISKYITVDGYYERYADALLRVSQVCE